MVIIAVTWGLEASNQYYNAFIFALICTLIFIYMATYLQSSQLAYVGGYLSLLVGLIESTCYTGKSDPTIEVLDNYTPIAIIYEILSCMQMLKNWKIRAMFFGFTRFIILCSYFCKYDHVSLSPILGTFWAILFGCILLYDSEESLMDIYTVKEENRKEKNKWISILDKLPIFMMIYDKAK
jgi:hypothetical protein